jgi:hypothetical protein
MKIIKPTLILLLFTFIFTNCSTDDDTDEFWDGVNVSNKFKAATFVFSSTEIGSCDKHGENNLNAVINSEINNIAGNSVNGLVLFPSITDPLYNHISEELKFLYDQNGDQTFKSFPSFVDDMNCFDIDSLSWYNSIELTTNRTPLISLGTKTSLKGDQQTIYVRGIYNEGVSRSHSIALYLFKKSIGANQKTTTGQTIYKTHENVVYSGATNTYGKVLESKSKSEEFHSKFQFDLNNVPISEIGFAVIVYELTNGKPTAVINSTTF